MKIHLFDLLNMPNMKIVVNIQPSLKNRIKNMINDDIYSFARELKTNPTRLYEYFIWKKSFTPLNVLFKLAKKFDISHLEIEKNIVSYKQQHVPAKNSIENPRLPIEISPYMTSIVANLFFDGSVPKDGKGTYYNQKNKDIMNDFIKKINHVFGGVQYKVKRDHRGVLKCRMPRLIGEICKDIYRIKDFGSFDSRIPRNIFNLPEEHKISFFLTAILDEGSISYDGDIQFGVSNLGMMIDFKKLCNSINIETGEIKKHKQEGHYYVYIKSIKRVNNFLNRFSKKYPEISLNYKGERLKKAIQIKQQKFSYTKDFADKRKNLILSELGNKKCSVNYLADKFIISPRTIRRYMYKLMKEKKVSRIKFGAEFIYRTLG